MNTLHVTARGASLDLSSPKIMGVLNCTPDSFSDGGRYVDVGSALGRVGEMRRQGASIIDVGGESTRPGSLPVSATEELNRVMPVLENARSAYPDVLFSIDTTKFEVAEAALKSGVHFINDVSGLRKEPRFTELCSRYDAGLIIMHAQSDPETMQINPVYDDVVQEVCDFLMQKIQLARHAGVRTIITDPGIGFGKTVAHNLTLINNLQKIGALGYPCLIGASRKSFIGTLLGDRPPEGRLAGTIAVHYQCLVHGAKILRVHDVQEAFDSILIYTALNSTINAS